MPAGAAAGMAWRDYTPAPPPSPPPPFPPCVLLDPATKELPGGYRFAAQVPNWRSGARIQVALALPDGVLRASCDAFCEREEQCKWCHCSTCDRCAGSGVELAIDPTKRCIGADEQLGHIASCWGARVAEHTAASEAVLRLGERPSDAEFGCTVELADGMTYAPPRLSCVEYLAAPPPLPDYLSSPPPARARQGSCEDYRPSLDAYDSEVWFDSRGPNYDCWYYEHGGAATDGCAVDGRENFDRTAKQACCVCGGGSTGHEGCSMGAALHDISRGPTGAHVEVSVPYWRRAGTVTIEFPRDFVNTGENSRTFWQAEPEILELQQVWDAEVVEDGTKRPRPANVLTFVLGEPGAPGATGAPSFSFRAAKLPSLDTAKVSCADPGSPSPPPPPRPPPWPPLPPPLECELGVHPTLAPIAGYGTAATLMHVTVDRWVDGSEVELQFGAPALAGAQPAPAPAVLASWGAVAAPTAASGSGWRPASVAPPLRLTLGAGPRAFFGVVLDGAVASGDGPRAAACTVRENPPPPPSARGCSGAQLEYGAERRDGAYAVRVRVQPWAPHALVTLQYGELAPPRVAAGSVRGAELLTSDAVARASSALRFRLAATAADASSAFEFETRDDARLSPASLRCEEQLVADSAPSASAYRTCVAIRAAATNTLSLQPPRWCHHLGGDSCEKHFYSTSADWIVPCRVNASGRCDARSSLLSCVPPERQPRAPPAPPAAPPGALAGAGGAATACAPLLRPPVVHALTSASFEVTVQLGAPGAAAPEPGCTAAAADLAVEVRRAGEASWLVVATRDGGAATAAQRTILVDEVRCGTTPSERCLFRVRPARWAEPSRPSAALGGLPLPARQPASAERVELRLRGVSLQAQSARDRLVDDVAAALGIASANVHLVEARDAEGSTAVVLDLGPSPPRDAPLLARQLASLVPLPRSDLYGGDLTQYVDGAAGVLRLDDRVAPRPIPCDAETCAVLRLPVLDLVEDDTTDAAAEGPEESSVAGLAVAVAGIALVVVGTLVLALGRRPTSGAVRVATSDNDDVLVGDMVAREVAHVFVGEMAAREEEIERM